MEGNQSSNQEVEQETWAEFRKRHNAPEIEKEYDEFDEPEEESEGDEVNEKDR